MSFTIRWSLQLMGNYCHYLRHLSLASVTYSVVELPLSFLQNYEHSPKTVQERKKHILVSLTNDSFFGWFLKSEIKQQMYRNNERNGLQVSTDLFRMGIKPRLF